MEFLVSFFSDKFQQFWSGALAPLFYPLNPSHRVYWLFLLSSLLFAVVVLRSQNPNSSTMQVFRQVFARDAWLTKSSLQDVLWLVGNSILKVLFLVPLVGGQLSIAILVSGTLQRELGSVPELDLPFWLIAAIYTLVFFVMEDLSRFVLHFGMHKVPWLWRFHRVHHSATTLTPITVYRVHPAEMALYYLRSLLVFGVVTGFFIYLFGRRLSGYDILGVDALGFLFNVFAANLRHSPIWLSFGFFERWFISPAQHQLHHSSDVMHKDINFGTCFAFWDRFLGSWLPAREKVALKYGLSS